MCTHKCIYTHNPLFQRRVFKLGLWSALVFFEHGAAMQLATALVVNVLQLCIHLIILPMGGDEAELLNRMQGAALVLTTCVSSLLSPRLYPCAV